MDTLERLSQELYELFHSSGRSVATAESCTAGQVARQIVSKSGASEYFRGGIVAYTNQAKENVLGVSHNTLKRYTAVSEETAREMAQGARRVLGADYAVAVTGVAGPSGGTPDIPVGTIWLCAVSEQRTLTRRLTEDHGREENLTRATGEALRLLIEIF